MAKDCPIRPSEAGCQIGQTTSWDEKSENKGFWMYINQITISLKTHHFIQKSNKMMIKINFTPKSDKIVKKEKKKKNQKKEKKRKNFEKRANIL